LDKRPNRLGSYVVAGVIAGSLVLSQTPTAWAQAKPGASVGVGVSVGASAATPPAGAKADLTAAKKHYAEGEKKFKADDFAGALVEFKEANDIKSTPHAERYLGLCEDKLNHYRAAADWFDKFLTHVPDKLASQGDEIRKRDAEIKAMPGKVHIESNPTTASISIDDKPQASPTPTDVDLAPGSHTVRFTAPGRLAGLKTIDVGFASTQSLSADLDPDPAAAAVPAPVAPVAAVTPAPAAAPAPPPPPEPRSKVPAIVTGALAVAAAGVGTVFGIIALGDKSDFDKNPTTQTADDGDTHALIADMAFGVALTFGVTSAVLFLTRDDPPAPTSSIDPKVVKKAAAVTVTPTPIVGPHTGGAGFVLRF
jgi:hypothetical protein